MSMGLTLRPWTLSGELRATLRLALPLIAAQVAAFSGNVVDVLLAGHFSAHVLGVVSVGVGVLTVPIMLVLGTMMAVSPTVAQLDGAGRRREAGAWFAQALWLGALVGGLACALLYFGGPVLLGLFAVDPALVPDALVFVHTIAFVLPGLGVFIGCRGFSDGLSMPQPGLWFNLLGLATQVGLGVVLVYGATWGAAWGAIAVPALGSFGTALSNVLTVLVQVAGFVLFIATSRRYGGLGVGARLRPDPRRILALARLGLPIAASLMLETALFGSVALVLGRFGEQVAASQQVALNVAALSFMVPLGMSNAITVRVGNAAGRGDRQEVRRAGMSGLLLTLITQSVTCVLLLSLPREIVGLYTEDPGVRATAATLLVLAGIFQFSDGIQVASSGALRGIKDVRMPMAITAFSYWAVGMPVGLYLAFPAGLGPRGMWMGLIAGLTAAATLLFARFERLSRPYDTKT